MGKLYTSTIDSVTPSFNKIAGKHWSKIRGKGGVRDEWLWLVKIAFGVKEPACSTFAEVRIARISKKTLDYDNFVAGCKYLVDALRKFGHIVDDTSEWVRIDYEQRQIRKFEKEHMLITLYYPD